MGQYSWIPPILSLDIPTELIARLLTHNFYFYVFIDVGHVKRRITSLAPNVGVTELEGAIAFKIRKGEWSVFLGPRPVERVLYGLGSLGSALQTLATMAEVDIDPESIVEKFGGLSQRSR